MQRERTITRTMKSLEIALTIFDKTTKSTATVTVTTPKFKTQKELEKYLDSYFNDETIRWVEIVNILEHNDLYAITETDFLKYGHKVEKINKEDNN